MSVQIEGFEEYTDTLAELQEKFDGDPNELEIPMGELFPDTFMRAHTEFESIDSLFDDSPWGIDSEADLRQIPEAEFDEYIDMHTGFSSWEAMLTVAAREWITRQLES